MKKLSCLNVKELFFRVCLEGALGENPNLRNKALESKGSYSFLKSVQVPLTKISQTNILVFFYKKHPIKSHYIPSLLIRISLAFCDF